jgi:hypothetical protein
VERTWQKIVGALPAAVRDGRSWKSKRPVQFFVASKAANQHRTGIERSAAGCAFGYMHLDVPKIFKNELLGSV